MENRCRPNGVVVLRRTFARETVPEKRGRYGSEGLFDYDKAGVGKRQGHRIDPTETQSNMRSPIRGVKVRIEQAQGRLSVVSPS